VRKLQKSASGNKRGNNPQISRVSQKHIKSRVLRTWRVSIIRSPGQVLGDVEASDQRTAEAVAVTKFNLSDEQRKRLVVQERV
jgi:hypothetical protein